MESIKTCRIGIFVLIVLVMAVQAGADERTWDGGGLDTEWATAGNWNPDGYSDSDYLTVLSGTPTSTANVIADNGGIITLDGSAAVANFTWDTYIGYTTGVSRLNVLNGANLSNDYGRLGFYNGTSGIVTVSGVGSTWTNSGDIYAGGGWSDTGGTGMLNIADGGNVSSDYGYLGYSSDSSGTATVSGAGSQWTNSSDLYVGRYGTGTLNITNGGAVSNAGGLLGYGSGSSGTATVSGAGSTWTNVGGPYVGYNGTGTLNITDGGVVNSNSGYLGYKTGSSGTVTVSGVGSTWTNNGYLRVGYSGTGTLTVENGGTVNAETLWAAGSDLKGNGTINVNGLVSDIDLVFDAAHGTNPVSSFGAGGTLNLNCDGTGILGAGYRGTASITVTDGVKIASVYGFLGYYSGSSGTATVSGAGSQWTISSSNFFVGNYGTGVLNITGGGAVSNEYCHMGYYTGSSGTVTVSGAGSTWTNSNRLYVGYYGNSVLNITGGGAVSNEYSYLGYHIDSSGTVTVSGAGSTWTNNGRLHIGYGYDGSYSIGVLNITDSGAVSNTIGYLGYNSGSSGTATVSGTGSTWTNSSKLYVGRYGQGTLYITDGGLVSVAETLTIDYDGDGDGFINMATGGMLALYGDADDSLTDFLDMISGTDAIRYWDDSASDWADITGATYGQDYTLTYLTEGDLTGYTVLTVPEPVSAVLLLSGGILVMFRRRRK